MSLVVLHMKWFFIGRIRILGQVIVKHQLFKVSFLMVLLYAAGLIVLVFQMQINYLPNYLVFLQDEMLPLLDLAKIILQFLMRIRRGFLYILCLEQALHKGLM